MSRAEHSRFARGRPYPRSRGHVRTRRKASRSEAACTLYGVHAPRAWSCGSNTARRAQLRKGSSVGTGGELRDGLEPVLRGARGTTIETSEVGTVLDQGSSSSQGEEGQHVAGIGAREPCASRNATSSSTSPPKLAWLNTTPTSRRIQAARTALDLGRPPPSP